MNKLFTHTDLDGVGCAIIAKLVYGDEIDISFCDYNEVDEKVGKCQPNNYDHIDITDISVGEKLGKSIDENYSNQVNLYDHHATAKDLDKYSWAVVKVNDEETGLMTCGTEIYYNHIGQYIDKEYRLAVESFVKYVTLWDTWRWKEKNSGLAGANAKKINTLFGIYGREKFIKWAIDHIKSGVFPNFTVADLSILEAKQNEIFRYIDEKDNQYIKRKDFAGRVFGVVFAENYISELGNALCERHPELAYAVIIDIGIIKNLNPLQIYARSTKYDRCGIPGQFGGVLYCTWYNSKINLSLSEWIKISKDSDVKTVCSRINIPYYRSYD